MKKNLPLILLGVGILVVVGAFFFIRSRKKGADVEEEELALIEVELKDRPVASLTPTEDGHYLNLKVEKIQIPGAETMDYELLYKTGTGITQGVPGMVDVKGKKSFEAELLLGSESSGKFRYDEGVEEGTLALRFRNDKGKLLIKFETDFHLQHAERKLTSLDGKFTYTFDKTPSEGFFVVMETFGYSENPPGNVSETPYGVFSSFDGDSPGEVEGDVTHFWTGSKWKELEGSKASNIGIFVSVSE